MSDDGTFDILGESDDAIPGIGGRGRVVADRYELIDALSSELSSTAHACVRSLGSFQLVLAPTPLTMHLVRSMLIDPAHRGFPWTLTEVWLTDFMLGAESPWIEEIMGMLIEHGGMSRSSFHAIDPTDENAVIRLEEQFRRAFVSSEVRDGPDCAVIGLDGRWVDVRCSDSHEPRAYGVCTRTDRLAFKQSQVRACASIIAAGTMSHIESVRALAERIAPGHRSLSWYVARAEDEESR